MQSRFGIVYNKHQRKYACLVFVKSSISGARRWEWDREKYVKRSVSGPPRRYICQIMKIREVSDRISSPLSFDFFTR